MFFVDLSFLLEDFIAHWVLRISFKYLDSMQDVPTELALSTQKHQRTSSRGNKKYNVWCSKAIKLLQPVPYVYDLYRRVFNNEF